LVECPSCRTSYSEAPAFCGACGAKMPGGDTLMAAPADPLIGLVIDNRYRVVDLIGRGGMGAVYRVEHVKMGKIMAMKILHGELSSDHDLCRRFKREAETVSRLSHLNNVSVFDFGSDKGMMYLVMEYIDGRDLGDILRREGPLPFERCARILMQVCAALSEAHAKGIIHRDLKPENILVGRRDEREDFVKVLDYGLAQLRDLHRTKITQQGSLVGTPYYMAPEHIRSEGVDHRADIYSLGTVMFQLLTGKRPFTAETPMGIITKHLTEEPEAPSASTPSLAIPTCADHICIKAMAKNPEDRFSSASAMRDAFALALEEQTGGPKPEESASDERPSWRLGDLGQATTDGWRPEGLPASSENERDTFESGDLSVPARRSSFAGSVVIGDREVAIGTRSDFFSFKKKSNRRKLRVGLLLAGTLLCVAGAGVLFLIRHHRSHTDPTLETEPNDTMEFATALTAGRGLNGFISGQQPSGDIDWYLLRGPATGNWAVSAEVSGVAGIDLALQLAHPGDPSPLTATNQTGKGGGERIGPWVIQKPEVYLQVREARELTATPGNASTPYTVVYFIYDATGLEVEPNNEMASATPITPQKTVSGTIGGVSDREDWFFVGPDHPVSMGQVSTSAQLDIELLIRSGPLGTPFNINRLGPGQGEGVRLPEGPGPTRIGIRAQGSSANPGTYRLLAQ
jgi:serine/threonine protein kinase